MLCFDNRSHFLDAIFILDFFAFLAVFIKQTGRWIEFISSCNMAAITYVLCYSYAPAMLTTDLFSTFIIMVLFIGLYFALLVSIQGLAYFLLLFMFIGPFSLVFRTHFKVWIYAQFHVEVSDKVTIILLLIILAIFIISFNFLRDSDFVQRHIANIVLSAFCVLGANTMITEGDKLANTKFCCGKDADNVNRCPVTFGISTLLVYAGLIIGRLMLMQIFDRWFADHFHTQSAKEVAPYKYLVSPRHGAYPPLPDVSDDELTLSDIEMNVMNSPSNKPLISESEPPAVHPLLLSPKSGKKIKSPQAFVLPRKKSTDISKIKSPKSSK